MTELWNRIVNTGCSYPWTIDFYECFSNFTQFVTSSKALIVSVSVASSEKNDNAIFLPTSQKWGETSWDKRRVACQQPRAMGQRGPLLLHDPAQQQWCICPQREPRCLTPLKNEAYIKQPVQALYKNELFSLCRIKQDSKLRQRRESQADRQLQNSGAFLCLVWAVLPGWCPAKEAGKAAKVSVLLPASRNQRKQSLKRTLQRDSSNQRCSVSSLCLWRSEGAAVCNWSGQNWCDGGRRDLQIMFCGAWRYGRSHGPDRVTSSGCCLPHREQREDSAARTGLLYLSP